MSENRSLIGDAARFLFVAGLLAGFVWYVAGDRIRSRFRYRGTDLSYTVKGDAKVAPVVERHMNGSHLWKVYFSHVREAGGGAMVEIDTSLERTLHGPWVQAVDRYNDNGYVQLDLKVRNRQANQAIFTRRLKRSLPAGFAIVAGSEFDAQEQVFRSTESKAMSDLGHYLNIAAMKAMSRHPEKAAEFAPAVVELLDSDSRIVASAAADTLCAFGPKAAGVRKQVEKLSKHSRDVVRKEAKRALQGIR